MENNHLAVLVMDGVAVLHVDVLLHFMTGDAEGLAVGPLHGGVEATPENDAAGEGERQQPEQLGVGKSPGTSDQVLHSGLLTSCPWHAHRCWPPKAWHHSAAHGIGCRSNGVG